MLDIRCLIYNFGFTIILASPSGRGVAKGDGEGLASPSGRGVAEGDGEGLASLFGSAGYAFFDFVVYTITHRIKLTVYFIIGKAENFDSVFFNGFRPEPVAGYSFFFIVLRAVNFNYKLRFVTVKVSNIIFNNALFIKLDGVVSQKQIPKLLFVFGHVFTQTAGIFKKIFILWNIHKKPPYLASPFGARVSGGDLCRRAKRNAAAGGR